VFYPAPLLEWEHSISTLAAAERGRALWNLIHDTDKVEGGLMVLFFGLVFSIATLPWKFFCRRTCWQRYFFCSGLIFCVVVSYKI